MAISDEMLGVQLSPDNFQDTTILSDSNEPLVSLTNPRTAEIKLFPQSYAQQIQEAPEDKAQFLWKAFTQKSAINSELSKAYEQPLKAFGESTLRTVSLGTLGTGEENEYEALARKVANPTASTTLRV